MQAREYVQRGNYYLGRRQFPEAIKEYEDALRVDPTNNVAKDNIVLAHNNWGIVYFQQHKYEEAEKEWRHALSLDSSNHLAKHNIDVLKQTLARRGMKLPSEVSAESGPKEEPKKGPASSVTILTPGLKQSVPSSSGSSSGASSDSPAATTGGSTSAVAAPPATPTPPATPPVETGFDTPPTSLPASTGGGGGPSFEDQLTGVEVKIYGRRQPDLSIIQRIEKVEKDTTGAARTGTIKERIDFLKQSYGL